MNPDDGLTVMMTPQELAAVLESESLHEGGTFGNRLIGTLRILSCGVEVTAGSALLLTPEPTMLTKVGGGALFLHGTDQCATGARQVWTGRAERSLTEQGATSMARALGADERTARTAGIVADIGIPIGASLLAASARVTAVRAGRVSLAQHEATSAARGATGGHTIARHVGRTDAQLTQRMADMVARGRNPSAISTFPNLATAERAMSRALRAHKAGIQSWAQNGGRGGDFVREIDLSREIGRGVLGSNGQIVPMTKVRFVMRLRAHNGMPHYIVTAYPVP